ncbi:HAD-IA family hydrolase [Clostridium akagii]|uniref:HAD-IA family hydrolase n=1 Tax=Clostridium akagii TaxID=91623 RepID=UPI00056A7EB5|nr:HAD-IA family hydrolase [Clostridium akagii]
MQLNKGKKTLSFDKHKIKAILIDSGTVLNAPVTGEWFISPNFFSYVDKKNYNSISASQKRQAFIKAGEYISDQNLIINEKEEYKHFVEYYRIFSKYMPQLQLHNKQIQAIAKDLVYNYYKYSFYKDVFKFIPELSKKYKLAVVSDAWPSLETVFRKANLMEYFSSFVISSVKGVTKPNELMYKTALEELKISAEEAIFIDDSIKNCDGAIELGISSFVLCRDWRIYIYNKVTHRDYNIIRNLKDVRKLLN